MLFFWTFYLLKNPEKWVTVSTEFEQVFLTLVTIRNVSWAANHHIRMISEGSCDTEDWSNNAENSALHHMNKFDF